MTRENTQRDICYFCSRTFTSGSWQIGISDFASEARECEICRMSVCQECSFSWGHEIDMVKKICHQCMLRYEFRKAAHTPDTIKRFRYLIKQKIDDYVCPNCSRTYFILDIFRMFMWCYRCQKFICPSCTGMTDNSMAGHCKSCDQLIKNERVAIDRACIEATTNCDRCGKAVRGIYIGSDHFAPGTTRCSFCGIRVCPSCLLSVKKGRNVIPACPECAKKSPHRPAIIKDFC